MRRHHAELERLVDARTRELRTLHAELEQRVKERTAELTEANQELETYSYSVSHELRSPLRAIDGFTALVARAYEGEFDEEGQRLFGQIRWNAQRMGQLIDDFLEFSRAGRSDLIFSAVDMTGSAKAAFAQVVKDPASISPVSIFVDDLPGATGDAALLQRVWENLLSNAVKFSAMRERPEIRIEGTVTGGEAIYRIHDNGVGFDMKYVDKLFGVFHRLQGQLEFEGTGVGLALVRRIVTRHGGRVWAEGELDRGATFSFSLPSKAGKDPGSLGSFSPPNRDSFPTRRG
jgi:light-regulated signal transduction histidine kinase (bacteriophytochrome)